MIPNTLTKEHYLSIKLETELFAISVHKVLEVLQMQHVTKVPNVPEFIKGVINFRGEILPVVDARHKFNMVKRDDQEKYVIIVLDLNYNNKNMMLGVIVDGVKDVFELAASDIKEVPDLGYNFNVEFLNGMVKLENGFLMLLNVDRIFSATELNYIKNNEL